MGKGELKKLLEEVKVNIRRLDECPGPHEFKEDEKRFMKRSFLCTKCQGRIDFLQNHWYQKGLGHGRMDVNKD